MSGFAGRVSAYLWPHRGRILWALSQVCLISGFELLKPWPIKLIIDSVLGGQPLPGGLGAGAQARTGQALWGLRGPWGLRGLLGPSIMPGYGVSPGSACGFCRGSREAGEQDVTSYRQHHAG